MKNRFYGYILKYPDGTPFCVGKGQGSRWLEHEAEARSNARAKETSNAQKTNLIRKIWETGGEVIREKVFENLTEEKAFELERDLIRKYRLRRFGGLLVNNTLGGEGTSGYEYTEEQLDSLRERQKRVGEWQKDNRIRKAARAYVEAYSAMTERLQNEVLLSPERKTVLAEAYAEVKAFLAKRMHRRSWAEKQTREYARKIFEDLDIEIAFRYLMETSARVGKLKAERESKEISNYARLSNFMTEGEVLSMAVNKALSYCNRRYTSKYGKLKYIDEEFKKTGRLTEGLIVGVMREALNKFLS